MITVVSTVTLRCGNEECFEKDTVVLEIPINATVEEVYDQYERQHDWMSNWRYDRINNEIYCSTCHYDLDLERAKDV